MPRDYSLQTKWRDEFCEQAYKFCLLGAINKQLAEFFDVSEKTIEKWLREKPAFREAVSKGKARADAEVASSMYHAAKGYSHDEDKIMQFQGEPVIVPTKKHYPPDATAGIFWLTNRHPDKWKRNVDGQQQGVTVIFRDFTGAGEKDITPTPPQIDQVDD